MLVGGKTGPAGRQLREPLQNDRHSLSPCQQVICTQVYATRYISTDSSLAPKSMCVFQPSLLPWLLPSCLVLPGTAQQSYVTRLQCPASGSVVNRASLLASTGQEVAATASLLKNCYQLGVALRGVGAPTVAR